MKMLNISVIIPTRNRVDSLIETIDRMYSCEYIPNQIVIIDQSEKKISEEIKKRIKKYDGIEVIYEYQQVGSLTKARNQGLRLAKNEIVIFSDDDIYVEELTILNIFNRFNKDNTVSLIGAIDTLDNRSSNSKLSSIMGYIFFRKKYKHKKGYVMKSMFGRYPQNINKIVKTQWAMGYFFVIRKSIALEGNIYFDEKLKSYAYPEDLDFTYRFGEYSKKLNLDMIIDPEIRVEHRVSKEWRLTTNNHSLMFVIHREYLSYKLFPNSKLSRLMTRWSNFGEILQRIIKKDNPKDIIRAQYICDIHRNEIKTGEFLDSLFD